MFSVQAHVGLNKETIEIREFRKYDIFKQWLSA